MLPARPTFDDAFHRVAALRPRIRGGVNVARHRHRGRTWIVLRDAASHRFFRISAPAWAFAGLLDGRRSVEEAWALASEARGDDAPTQGEAIQILATLHEGGLLLADVPGDARLVFRRAARRSRRERLGKANPLFLRVPLVDPDPLLRAVEPVLGPLFSTVGFVLWLALLAAGGVALAGRWDELLDGVQGVVAPANLPLLYLAFAGAKLLHELGHGLACARFGRRAAGTAGAAAAGEVHELGVMLLVLLPVPYVDASSAWALPSRAQRIIVGAAGMIVELALAAVAAVVWASTADGLVNALAYNLMIVAGVSTLLFNLNPLLRYDGYYILADAVGSPNLAQRARQQVAHVVRRAAWGVRGSRGAADTPGEAPLLVTYAVLAGLYRFVLAFAIALLVADRLPVVGVLAAAAVIMLMLVLPAAKLARYVLVDPSLERTRGRAIGTTLAVLALAAGLLALVPAPRRVVLTGTLEPAEWATVVTAAAGEIRRLAQPGDTVGPGTAPVAMLDDPALLAERDALAARVVRADVLARRALDEDPAAARIAAERLRAARAALHAAERRLAALAVAAPILGEWDGPAPSRTLGRYAQRGEAIGVVRSTAPPVIRALITQDRVGLLPPPADLPGTPARVRLVGQAGVEIDARAVSLSPAGRQRLFSDALAASAGGEVATRPNAAGSAVPEQRVFELLVSLEPGSLADAPTRFGARAAVRIALPPEPVGVQLARAARRLVQGRLGL